MPPSIDDWLPEDHPARFISEVVDEMLDLDEIYGSYAGEGAPPYDPAMMLKLLLWGYSSGVTSSREMERRCVTDVAFRFLTANQFPDYRSISRFRRRHMVALRGLFTQVLVLCQGAGLVRLGRVGLDGTKVRASASRRKAMSYGYLVPRIEQLQAEVDGLLAEGERVDAAEDEQFGVDRRGDELPAELARRVSRLVKMRAAKQAMEEDARARAAADRVAAEKKAAGRKAAGKQTRAAAGKPVKVGAGGPGDDSPDSPVDPVTVDSEGTSPVDVNAGGDVVVAAKEQRSFTDPESRIMKMSDGGFQYAYNVQAIADEGGQVILAVNVIQAANDVNQLFDTVAVMGEQLDAAGIAGRPKVILADAGYCSDENLQHLGEVDSAVLIATGRVRHGEQVPAAPRGRIPKNATLRERMARRLRTKPGHADYARRKAIIEPVFGQMKTRQHAGQLRLRGLDGATGEVLLHALVHNLRKLCNVSFNPGLLIG